EESAKTLGAELEAATAAAAGSRTEAERTASATRAALAAADELGHRGQLMDARLEALRQALDRGEGLTAAGRAPKEGGARLGGAWWGASRPSGDWRGRSRPGWAGAPAPSWPSG